MSTHPGAVAAPFEPHAMHTGERVWQENNCYVDAWIELLHGWGLDPCAVLPFTVTQDFEGDQFTFPKFPLEDLEYVYGVTVQELAIYDSLDQRVFTQVSRGNAVLVEADGYYLRDNFATSYHREHPKTTIFVTAIDPLQRRASYYHNTGFYEIDGDDYDGIFRLTPGLRDDAHLLFPYVEFTKRSVPTHGLTPVEASLKLLGRHLLRRPARNPISGLKAVFPAHLGELMERGEAFFHLYSFNVFRQLGANFELLAQYLRWLNRAGLDVPESIIDACQCIAAEAKVVQFRLVRAVIRKRADLCAESLDTLERSYDHALQGLSAWAANRVPVLVCLPLPEPVAARARDDRPGPGAAAAQSQPTSACAILGVS
jgi:hypothetical protein